MKKYLSIIMISALCLGCSYDKDELTDRVSEDSSEIISTRGESKTPIIEYFWRKENVMPDFDYMTHVIVSKAVFETPYDGTLKLKSGALKMAQLMDLKKKNNSDVKVILMVGGWGVDGFSQIAKDNNKVKKFISNCSRLIDSLHLDGIDIDWEYPGNATSQKIGYSSNDKENLTKMMKTIRETFDKYYKSHPKILSIDVSANHPDYYDMKNLIKYVNYVNVMTYDMGEPPYHNSPLHSSPMTKSSCNTSILSYISAGVPESQLVMGIPFYGHANGENSELKEDISYSAVKELIKKDDKYTQMWDDDACVPYLVWKGHSTNICSFENASSIADKCKYIKKKGLAGAMVWSYDHDDNEGTLRQALRKGLWNY